jgi:hypothetical protein
MLKKEDVLKELGITEEVAKEQNINIDALLKLAQMKGDELANNKSREIEELKKSIVKPIEEPKNSNDGIPLDQVQKMIDQAISGIAEENKKNNEERLVKEFVEKATKKGYSNEQVEYFTSVTKVDALSDFNFSMFPLKEEEDFGNGTKNEKGKLNEEQEVLKMLDL